MSVPVVMPNLGADEVRLSLWFSRVGDRVFEGDRLVEVIVGEATFDVAAPIDGRLSQQMAVAGDRLEPLQTLGQVQPVDDE